MKKLFFILVIFIFCNIYFYSEDFTNSTNQINFKIELLQIFKNAYPEVLFESEFDSTVNDWKIKITYQNRNSILYWAAAKFLPLEELSQKELYSSLLYHYPNEIPNPKNFTEEDILKIKEFTNQKNRSEGKGTPQFLYNLIYEVETRISTEAKIKSHSFLGKKTNTHQFIHQKLNLVQNEIFEIAKIDNEVNSFLEKLDSADSYAWRVISDSGNRSVHSMGLAIDVLPKGWQQKNLYWAWRRDIDPQNWMLLDLDRRWMPPQKVIEIFEEHGFIWGGKWIIWDNMHFEYRPEVILFNKFLQEKNLQN